MPLRNELTATHHLQKRVTTIYRRLKTSLRITRVTISIWKLSGLTLTTVNFHSNALPTICSG
jgi:hypothetical protein